jgi:hypothetical protein
MYNETRPDTHRVALNQGLIFGSIMGGVALIILIIDGGLHVYSSLMSSLANNLRLSYVQATLYVSILFLLFRLAIAAAVFILAGWQAAKRTGQMATGVLAGLYAGIVYGLINLCLTSIVFLAFTAPDLASFHVDITSMLGSTIINNILTGMVLTGAVFGSLFGLIGGSLGRKEAGKKRLEYSSIAPDGAGYPRPAYDAGYMPPPPYQANATPPPPYNGAPPYEAPAPTPPTGQEQRGFEQPQ